MERKLIKDNPDEIVRILFRHYGLKYDGYARSLYHSHPRFRRIEAVSYLLSRYGVDSSLIKTDLEEMKGFPVPMIVNYDGLLLPVVGIGEGGHLTIINEAGKNEEIDLGAIDNFWDHLVLVLEKDGRGTDGIAREKTAWWLKQLALIAAVVLLGAGACWLSVRAFLMGSLMRDIFLVTSVAGLVVSVLFHIQRLDRGNPFVNKICHSSSGHSSKRDCASILDSNASKFLGLFSWVDIGSVYFLVFLVVAWSLPTRGSIVWLTLISLLALAYVPYSIYYQGRVAKHWCPLCLSVQAILFFNAVVSAVFVAKEGVAAEGLWAEAVKMGVIALLVILFYCVLVNLLIDQNVQKERDKKFREAAFSPEGLQALLYGTPEIDMTASAKIAAIDRDGTAELTMVINPLCSPCMKKTREILEILNRKRYTDLSLIFLVDAKSIIEKAYAKKLISASLDGKLLETLEAHVKRFPQLEEFEVGDVFKPNAKEILASQLKWCDDHHLMSTPKIFFNNHELSPLYSVKDIDYITE